MLNRFVRLFAGDPVKKSIDKYAAKVDEINALEAQFEAVSDTELRAKTDEFRARLAQGESLDDLLPEAYAVVREASKRTIGLRHYDVQLIGGIVLHQGMIAEMRTGEGKTLVATMPMYLNALMGNGVHLITVNDYLARRDARWMAPIFDLLGLTVGVLQMASRTENGKKAFLVDLERESPHEDQHQLKLVPRKEAYQADITYGTNSEFGFDYLRDNMTMRLEDRVQRGHHYAIIDEVDNVLVDEARTPLIISGPAQDDAEWYIRMAQVVKQLRPEDYEISERDRSITLTEIGEAHVEEILGMALGDPERPEDVTPEQARLLGFLEQALRAQYLFRRNKDYLVQAGKVIIIDEFTGRLMPGRRWSDGLHQAVEAKEGAKVQAENVTYATITIQNYFRMYEKLAGMTGTALTEAEEFDKIYKLDVTAIPTNLEYLAALPDSGLEELDDRDEQGYKYKYYAREDDSEKTPIFWKRKDYPDVVYRTQEVKFRAIMKEILAFHVMGRPILVGTTSVELSDRLSSRMKSDPLRRLAMVLILRKVWMEKNNREEDGRQIAELAYLNQPLEQLPIPDMRKMARDLEISFNPQEEENLNRLTEILDLSQADKPRLEAALQAGIPHQVLNARRHTEESQIIAGAGAFGAVTIATNMAGRGVDIKLGGEIAEEVISSVNRVLRKAGVEDPYDMTMEERRQALLKLAPGDYGIYGTEVEYYLRSMEDMERVKALGGLHVIGSERHEARRIDNQLRGRSARQGDPGSSRFYLSMEDELMRLFGGGQADGLMQRLRIDDAMPIEAGLVGRIVEGSQTRVEGANFDVRKHLLEYDDVLNSQRSRIYEQRDRIFVKEDLSEDVTGMLRTEVLARVPEALKDEEGPWKLLAWLDQIQPPLALNGTIFPSYTLKLLLAHIESQRSAIQNADDVVDALLAMAEESIKAEEEHVLRAVDAIIENTFERLEAQRSERLEAVDTFFQGLGLEEDEEGGSRSPRELVDELSNLVRFPVRLAPDQQRLLRSGDDRQALEEVEDEVRDQLEANLHNQAVKRLVGAVSRRLEDSLDVNADQLPADDWDALAEQVYTAATLYLEKRRERLLGDGDQGQIGKDLENALDKIDGTITLDHITNLLLMMPQGARATFDKKTHRRVWQRTTRLTYIFYAARFLESRTPEEIANDVLDHLEKAQAAIRWTWGMSAWPRLSGATWDQLDTTTQHRLLAALGEERCKILKDQPLQSLDQEDVRQAIDALGDQALTEIYRQLLLSVMTELWVDYLTQMEALRVSVGLEAYAQRDPLVQYKARASELFQTLLSNMRLGVISRMFTYRPRDMSGVQVGGRRRELDEEAEIALELEEENDSFVEMAEEMVEADVEAGSNGADAFTDAEPEPDPKTAQKTTLKEADGKGQPARQGGKQKLSKSQRRRRNRR